MPFTSPEWMPLILEDNTANDIDKTFTVPQKKLYQVMGVRVDYTSTATAGTRLVEIQFRRDDDAVFDNAVSHIDQEASLNYLYHFNPNRQDGTLTRHTNFAYATLPLVVLRVGWNIRVFEMNAVDAADDMLVRIQVLERATRP